MRPGLRRTFSVLHQYSVNRETSLSPQPVGHELLAPACAIFLYGIDYPQFPPSIQIKCLFPVGSHLATDTSFFRYTRISPVQGGTHCFGITRFDSSCQAAVLTGFFPIFGRLLLRPEGLYLLVRTSLRHGFLLAVSAFPGAVTGFRQIPRRGYPPGRS